jgi:YhhN family
MTGDLAHKWPWLLLSLIFGITYPVTHWLNVPGIWAILWKMGGLTFLVPYALRSHYQGDFAILASILALCAIGDGLVEISLELGAVAFGLAHITAIFLYNRHRRVRPVRSQQLLALSVLILTPFIAYFLGGFLAAAYSVLLGSMAASAWSSNFPRYRVGIGAMLFVASDLLLFAREGPLGGAMIAGFGVWYSYYAGMFIIATGVVQILLKRGHFSDAEGL